MCCRRLVVVDHELPPVMRDIAERCSDRCVTCRLDLLTVCFKLIHRVIRTRFGYACLFKDLCVEEHCLPITISRNRIFLTVNQRICNPAIIHVGSIFRIYRTNLINRYNLACLDKAVGVYTAKVKQYIGLRACLKVCGNSRLESFIGRRGRIYDCIARLCFPCCHRVFIILCVGVLTCECGRYHQFYRTCRLCRRLCLRRSLAACIRSTALCVVRRGLGACFIATLISACCYR